MYFAALSYEIRKICKMTKEDIQVNTNHVYFSSSKAALNYQEYFLLLPSNIQSMRYDYHVLINHDTLLNFAICSLLLFSHVCFKSLAQDPIWNSWWKVILYFQCALWFMKCYCTLCLMIQSKQSGSESRYCHNFFYRRKKDWDFRHLSNFH